MLWIFQISIYSVSWGVLFACLPFWMNVPPRSIRCQISQDLPDDQNVMGGEMTTEVGKITHPNMDRAGIMSCLYCSVHYPLSSDTVFIKGKF